MLFKSKLVLKFLIPTSCLALISCSSHKLDADNWYPKSTVKYTDSFETIKSAADKGDPDAAYIIGSYDSVQKKGNLTKDQGSQYLVLAANENYERAQTKLFERYVSNHITHYRKYKSGHIPMAGEIINPNDIEEWSIKVSAQKDDLAKAVYWAKKASCNRSIIAHQWLGYVYEANPNAGCVKNCEGSFNSVEMIGLLPQNLPMAYAHYNFLPMKPFGVNVNKERLRAKMSTGQIDQGNKIIRQFEKGECPYDNSI
jgi:hypothetical protein